VDRSLRAAGRNGLLALLSVASTLVVAEGLLRALDYPKTDKSGWRGGPPQETNQLGFRGRRIEYADSDVVVVLLGDSQVSSDALHAEQMPERRLQEHLAAAAPGRSVKVFTVGAGGYGTDQEYLALREYLERYRADVVLLWITLSNDVWNNVFPTHWPRNGTPKPTFRLDHGRLVGPHQAMGQRVPRFKLRALVYPWWPPDPDADWEKYLPAPYRPLDRYDGPVDTLWQDQWDQNTPLSRDENLDNEKSSFILGLRPPSARTLYGLDLTRALFGECRKLVEEHGGRFGLIAHGQSAKGGPVNPRLVSMDREEVVRVLKGRYYRVSNTQFWENVDRMTRGFPFFFLQIKVKDFRVSPTDGHMNAAAIDQVCADLAGPVAAFLPPGRTRTGS
jgi:hypothetical protein